MAIRGEARAEPEDPSTPPRASKKAHVADPTGVVRTALPQETGSPAEAEAKRHRKADPTGVVRTEHPQQTSPGQVGKKSRTNEQPALPAPPPQPPPPMLADTPTVTGGAASSGAELMATGGVVRPVPDVPSTPPPKRRGRPPKQPRVAMVSTRGEVNALTKLIDEDEPTVERDVAEERRAAREAHLATLVEMDVYVAMQRDPSQARPITIKWVDRPDKTPATARLTARGYEQPHTAGLDHFAATPANGTLRLLVAIAQHKGWTLGAGDAERAFLQAWLPADEPDIFVWPPTEAHEPPGTVWKLRKALPGLKGSAQVWGGHASSTLIAKHGLQQARSDECLYYSKEVVILRHMDDFFVTGPRWKVKQILEELAESLLVSGIVLLDHPGQKMQVLGRILTRTATGYSVRCSTKLMETMIKEEGFENARGALLPGEKAPQKEEDNTALDEEGHRHFRTQVGRLLWMAADRADIQHATMRLARRMAGPTERDRKALRRVVRYLARTRDFEQKLAGGGAWQVTGQSDADWAAGDEVDMKSITGGVIKVAGTVIMTYSRVQATTSLSSGESELMALTSVSAECLFWDGVLHELGMPSIRAPWIWCDSSAALAAAGRRGHRKLKHIELRRLVCQQWQAENRLSFRKVPTQENEADLMTKFVDVATLTRLCGALDLG